MIRREYLIIATVVAAVLACAIAAGMVINPTFKHTGTLTSTTANVKEELLPNVSVLVVVSTKGSLISEELNMLKKYLRHTVVGTLTLGRAGANAISKLPDALIIMTGNGHIPNNTGIISVAKEFLIHGKPIVFVATSMKPLNTTALLRFLKDLGLRGVTYSNIRSSINVKSNHNGELTYVLGIRVLSGEYPMIYGLCGEKGVRISATTICSYAVRAVNALLNPGVKISG